ncbi:MULTISPECIES: hypothetical protein [Pseudomonas]|uniref:hypothetical protein n=1 Tax=Pseudomonas TaxID=286 RepID=UPI000C88D34F|nr:MULTISPECIES: hypothetical protein [Pseudomonas]PMY37423.1 hypothetical protein C1Y36_28450 [Pseudomonas sp. FW306-2-2C-D06C]PYC42134.1 hypothetical protein DMW99_01905 [Pseudomonas chlororaphis]
MGETDNLTREKLREWQVRRLEVKDQMQLHPEKTLELSRILDLMDDEHAAILSGSTGNPVEGEHQRQVAFAQTAIPEYLSVPAASKLDLQLNITASNPEDLRRLLEMAVYELQGHIDTKAAATLDGHSSYSGAMSGTLGSYQFELGVHGEGGNE